MKYACPAGMLLAFVALPANATECTPTEFVARQTSGTSYDPAGLSSVAVRISIDASGTRPGSECARQVLSLRARDDAARIELRGPHATLRSTLSRANAKGRTGGSEIELTPAALAELSRTGRIEVDLIDIEANQFSPAGDYRTDLDLLVDGVPSQTLELVVRVEPAVRLIGEATRQLSLGEVSNGSEVTSRFFYASNSAVNIRARSQHGGYLQHQTGANVGRIPYRAYLSGQQIDFGSDIPIALPFSGTAPTASELKVQVLPQPARYGGVYRDVLTVEINAY